MTQSYFKAIIWDNSNYVQEQRRSKQLVALLNSSERLARRRGCVWKEVEGEAER